jgi:hypothetical protein
VIPLSPAAQGVLAAVPKIGKGGLVFTTNGKRPFGGFSKFKRAGGDTWQRRHHIDRSEMRSIERR